MSKNTKNRNVIRPAFMRNFTRNTIERYICIEIDDMTDNDKNSFVSRINETLWYRIQKFNEIANYNLPYVIVRRVESDEKNEKIRVIIQPDDEDYFVEQELIDDNRSHIILMKQLSPQRIIRLGNMRGIGRAEILADRDDKLIAAVDIFMDIAMFHSINYLDDLDDCQKNQFNQIKYKFFCEEKLKSYFYVNQESPPTYISFAFTQHIGYNDFDYYNYMLCWEKFLKTYYPGKQNKNLSPTEQLKKHIDYYNIDDTYKDEKFWGTKPSGAYLLLRTNQKPNTIERETRILNYFGKTTYRIGLIKVIPLAEYHMPYIRNDFEELNVSVFKIVKD